MNRNILTEVNRIKQMMGLVNEQGDPLTKTTTTQVSKNFQPLVINFSESFAPSQTSPMTITDEQKQQITNWLNQEGMDSVNVIANIESSSSKSWGSDVKNQEEATQYNIELANERAKTAKNTIAKLINSIKPNLGIKFDTKSLPNQGPEYTRYVDDANDEKYRRYQYVKLTLSVSGQGTTTQESIRELPFYRIRNVNFNPNSQIGTKPQSMGLVEGCVSVKNNDGVFVCEQYVPMYYANQINVGNESIEITNNNQNQIFTESSMWVPYNQSTNGGWDGSDLYLGRGFWSDQNKRVCFSRPADNKPKACANVDLGTNYISKLNWVSNPPGDEISEWALSELKKNIPQLYTQKNPQQ
jgi:hypothetical protein